MRPTAIYGNIETRGDDAGLVESPVQLDHDFATAVVVDDFELADVACRAGRAERATERKGKQSSASTSCSISPSE